MKDSLISNQQNAIVIALLFCKCTVELRSATKIVLRNINPLPIEQFRIRRVK
jgi:hypothetical protein